MTRWVIDCSFAAALFLPDKSSDHVRDFFQSARDRKELFVPVLWWYELANVIAISERRKLLKDADIQRILKLFNRFPLETDNTYGPSFVQKMYEITRTHGLSAYDAAYLELSLRLHASIASLDRQLIKAAEGSGVTTYH